MAIKIKSYLQEVLIRFDENGLIGAHKTEVEQAYETRSGRVHSETQQPAVPLQNSEIADLLSGYDTTLIHQIETLKSEITALVAENQTLVRKLDDATTAANAEH